MAFNVENEIKPRQRAFGGVWLNTSDFPFSFQHIIVYHNLKTFAHCEYYNELWTNASQQFTNNEKDIYIKFELNQEEFASWKAANKISADVKL